MREGMADVMAQLHAAVDSLLGADLDSFADDELLDAMRDFETASRRLAPAEQRLAAEVDRRGLAFAHGCAKTSVLLSQLLRISPGEARARMMAANRFASRRTMSGEVLPPLHPITAAAQATGEISARHAALIADAVDQLPSAVDDSGQVAEIETFLVEQARQFAPDQLAKVSRHLLEVLDPDGTLTDSDYRDRRRGLTVHQRPDGSVTGQFEGTAEFGELLLTILDVTAAPKPAADGSRDQRSTEQRNYDGVVDAMRLMLRARQLPSANGVLATVVLTMSAQQWASGQGLARTGHGALVPVAEAIRITRGETRIFPVVLADAAADPDPPPDIARRFAAAKPITAYGSSHRIFTEPQRLAMIARDGGCTFPGCTVSPLWCEADHVVPHVLHGPTSVDNGHLACPQHHRDRDRNGWTVTMDDGIPHWIPPAWIDPTRTPRRNRVHDPVTVG